MTTVSPSAPISSLAAGVDRFMQWLLQHWLLFVGLALGIWTILPWLAPILMRLGWYQPAWWIYYIYSLFCHQLPERSWFLFGPRFTPSLAEIQAASGAGADFFALRHFLGTPGLGWKLAWSDRMVSFYGGWFLFRFYEDHRGQTVCYCMAFNGRNARAGLPHLAKMAAKAGAVELICETEQEAVMRLYRRDGWRVAVYKLVLDL